MSKPQDRVTRSVLNYWSPQGAYPLLRFFAYTRKYILKDQPHSRRVSAPPGESVRWKNRLDKLKEIKLPIRANTRPCDLTSKQASQFSLLAFSFHRVENLLRNLILHFTLTLYLACFIWNEKTINEKWSLHLSCFFDSCLLTHSFAAHRHFSPKNSDHGYRWACELMSVVEVNLVKFVSAAPCWLLC